MKDLSHINVFSEKIPEDIFLNIKNLVNFHLEDHNEYLVGHIKKEVSIDLKQCKDIDKYLLKILTKTNLFENYMKGIIGQQHEQSFVELRVGKVWMNFQKENEFNPIHIHSGVFSFIIFIKIPYSYEEQAKLFPKTKLEDIRCGATSFLTFDHSIRGGIREEFLPLNPSYEGIIYFFRADLNHLVYPFYNTQEERITMSGNINLSHGS